MIPSMYTIKSRVRASFRWFGSTIKRKWANQTTAQHRIKNNNRNSERQTEAERRIDKKREIIETSRGIESKTYEFDLLIYVTLIEVYYHFGIEETSKSAFPLFFLIWLPCIEWHFTEESTTHIHLLICIHDYGELSSSPHGHMCGTWVVV